MDIASFFKKKTAQKRSSSTNPNEENNTKNAKKLNTTATEVIDCTSENKPTQPKTEKIVSTKTEKKQRGKVRAIVSSEDDDAFVETKDDVIKTASTKQNKTSNKKSVIEETPTSPPKEKQKKERAAVSSTYRPRWLQTDRQPPQHGMKAIPTGKPDCLKDLIFVQTGLNESLTREEMSKLITKYGGIERGSVSKKTNYLIAGFEMEDGRPITEGSKYKAATEKDVTIINEDKLLKMIYDSDPEANQKQNDSPPKKESEIKTEPPATVTPQPVVSEKEVDQTLLTSKYAPRRIEDIIGNRQAIESLRSWLQRWEDVHIKKTVQIEQNSVPRAALLSGPPGIGKTTTATLLCHLAGYDVIELNASDKRNKAAVHDTLRDSVSAKAFNLFNKQSHTRKVVLMDEVDGMSSGDRGGIAELIKIIETTQTPIICICNDRDSSKVRSLASHCYDLLFRKPLPDEIQSRVRYICDCEGLNLPPSTMASLIESTGGDMRQILNQLQILTSLKEKSNLSSVQTILSSFSKDQLLGVSAFEAGKAILTNVNSKSLQQRYDMFFCDYEMTPLIVQQNYLSVKTDRNNSITLMQMADAADALCDCETIHETMVRTNNWSLLPSMGVLTIRAGYKASGNRVFPQFPAVLGKTAAIRKNTRMLSEFQNHLSSAVSGSRLAIAKDYFDMLMRLISTPLMEGNVEEAIKRMDEYSISKDDYADIQKRMNLGGGKTRYELVPAKTKNALTRMYNSGNHSSTNVFADEEAIFRKVTKGKKGKKDTKVVEMKSEEEEEVEDEINMFDY